MVLKGASSTGVSSTTNGNTSVAVKKPSVTAIISGGSPEISSSQKVMLDVIFIC